MKIKIINPNTTWSMTQDIEIAGKKFARPDTQVYAVSPVMGPESIESFYDEYLAIPGLISEIIKGDRQEGADAFIVACFGDPGLQAAKEVTDKPVIGIAQAAFATAKMIAPNFSVVSVLDRSKRLTEDVLRLHGATDSCLSIRSTGLSVLEFDRDKEAGLKALAQQAKIAVEEDGAECIVLGCAGFVQFVEGLQAQLGVPVIDGVSPAVKFCEVLVDMGLKTSKGNIWAPPEKKEILGFENLVLY
jgi:allantoin racemase